VDAAQNRHLEKKKRKTEEMRGKETNERNTTRDDLCVRLLLRLFVVEWLVLPHLEEKRKEKEQGANEGATENEIQTDEENRTEEINQGTP
jgi:hypothetical protein